MPKEEEQMSKQEMIHELELALLGFVKRVAKGEAATIEEIEILPATASVLVALLVGS